MHPYIKILGYASGKFIIEFNMDDGRCARLEMDCDKMEDFVKGAKKVLEGDKEEYTLRGVKEPI